MAQIVLNPVFLGLAAAAAAYSIQKLEQILHDLPINLKYDRNKWHHILENPSHDHGFNNKCGEQCVKYVAEKIKAKVTVKETDEKIEIPVVKDTEKCIHDCTIGVELKLVNKIWQIGTAWHVGSCRANK